MALKLVRKKKATSVSRKKSEITKFLDAIDVQLRLAAGEKVKKGRGRAKSWMQSGAEYGVDKVLIPKVRNRPLYVSAAIVVGKQKNPPTNELRELKRLAAAGKLTKKIYAATAKPKKGAGKKQSASG